MNPQAICEACQSRYEPDNCPMCKLELLAQERDRVEHNWLTAFTDLFVTFGALYIILKGGGK